MIKLKINQFEVSVRLGYLAHRSLFLWLCSGVVAPHQTLRSGCCSQYAELLDLWKGNLAPGLKASDQ